MLLSLVMFSAGAFAAQADSLLEGIMQRGRILIGMTGDYKPFTWQDGAKEV